MRDRNIQTQRLNKLFDSIRAGSRKGTFEEICRTADLDPVVADNLLYESLGMSWTEMTACLRTGGRPLPSK